MLRKTFLLLLLIVIYGYTEWNTTGSLLTGHSGHEAVTLVNGDVLVIGGQGSRVCQIYDHSAMTWSYTDSLNVGRQNLEAVLLQDGRVLVIGGGYPYNMGHGTCEIYDPVAHTWSMTDTLNVARAYARSVVLPDGRVLVTGGLDIMTVISACEIWDPTTGIWSLANPSPEPQWGHDMCRLVDGRVLSIGGFRDFGISLAGCHIFNPSSNTWTTTNPLAYRRWKLSAIRLSTGDVLVAGGQDAAFTNIPYCEIFDADAATWSLTDNNINPGRIGHTCIALQPGDPRIMLIGGEGGLSDCELFDAETGTWSDTDDLIPGRGNHAAVLLNNGNILVSGGTPSNTDCQIFTPPLIGIAESKAERRCIALKAAPNPFRQKTEIKFSIDRTADISIRVYDAAGKLIKILIDYIADPGLYTVTWNGEDEENRSLPAGVYFVELHAGDHVTAQKITITR